MAYDVSPYPRDWVRLAEKDLSRVERMLHDDDAEAAGFFLQQAVEKFLKAFLLSRGWELERTHDLEALLNAALAYNPSLDRFRPACLRITEFYALESYPLLTATGLTAAELRNYLVQVEGLLDKLRAMTPR